MKTIMTDGPHQILRFDRGEELLTGLQAYCSAQNIHAAAFTALGASQRMMLSWYNLASKKYQDQLFQAEYEIASLTGNISVLGGEIAVHAHEVFSDSGMKTVGGHIKECVIGLTCELSLHIYNATMERVNDPATGLNLLQ